METRNYKFIGRPEDLDSLEKLFRHMEYLGFVGASRNLLVRVDGDGSGRIQVRNGKGERLDNKEYSTDYIKTIEGVTGIYDIG